MPESFAVEGGYDCLIHLTRASVSATAGRNVEVCGTSEVKAKQSGQRNEVGLARNCSAPMCADDQRVNGAYKIDG
jgi:hypothetical protein